MHFLLTLAICALVWSIVPRTFNVLVGAFVGFAAGGFLWSVTGMVLPTMVGLATFIGFITLGTLVGALLGLKA